jgi:arylsulfatase A-like enzyme
VIATALALSSCADPVSESAATSRPNFVLVIADDLGWNDVGYHGSEIATPQLDRLAAAGVRLEQFYTQPACSPTRAALLTGRYPFRYGLQSGVIRPWERYGLPLGERLVSELLAEAGYATGLIGKWHLGVWDHRHHPLARGFAHHYGPYLGSVDYWTKRRRGGLDWHRDGRVVDEPGYLTELLTRDAERWIAERSDGEPFFLVVSYTAPHEPLHRPPPPPRPGRYAPIENPRRRLYAAMVTNLDAAVGRVWRALERRGLHQETLFLFASDNGAAETSGASNAPLRGAKASLYEGALRVPAFALWPGRLAGGTRVDAPLHVVDLFPTLLGLSGAGPAQGLALDGVDIWPLLTGAEPAAEREIAHHVEPNRGALREGPWKLVVNGPRPPEGLRRADDPRVELYRIGDDPGETTDLAEREPERVAAMLQRLSELTAEAVLPLGTYTREPPPGFAAPAVWGAQGALGDGS